jgi:hypothetical protein
MKSQSAIIGVAAAAFLLGGLAVKAIEQDAANADSLDLRYAQAHVQLAEANLARVARANQRVANAVAGVVVSAYEEDMAVAKLRLQAAQGEVKDPFEVWLRVAEAAAKSAERQWKASLAANSRAAGTIHPLDVDRLRLRAEVTQLNLERGRMLVEAPAEARVQWQHELLYDELQRLDEEVLRNAPGSRIFPIWRY